MAELNELTINGSNYTFEDDVARGLANTEASRAQAAEQTLDGKIGHNTQAIANEKSRAEGAEGALQQLIQQVDASLINYYLKSETYSKAEMNAIIDNVKQFRYQVAATLPTASADTMGIIYLIPSANPKAQNIKEEYLTILDGSTYKWEHIGDTNIDLSGYSTTEQMNAAIANALASYYTKSEVDEALGGKQNTIDDLANIRSGASAGATAVQPSTLNSALSDTVAESGVYDVTANNNNAKFASLSALLGSENLDTLIPSAKRKGGMNIKFVQSSDNKYVQYMLMKNTFSITPSDWQFVGDSQSAGIVDSQQSSDLDITDNNGNILARFYGGNIKTKNFDSTLDATVLKRGLMSAQDKTALTNHGAKLDTVETGADKSDVCVDNYDADAFNISDDKGNIILMLKGGHIKTKNFDSASVVDDVSNLKNNISSIQEEMPVIHTINISDYNNNLRTAFASISPTSKDRYVIEIPEGTYDATQWFTSDELDGTVPCEGVAFKDYVKLQGIGNKENIIIQLLNSTFNEELSILKMYYWNEMDNLTLIASNCRYAVHDDNWDSSGRGKHLKITNCNFTCDNGRPSWGAGHNGSCYAEFINCKFNTTGTNERLFAPFAYHDNPYSKDYSSILLDNCRFNVENQNAPSVDFQTYGISAGGEYDTYVTMKGCKGNTHIGLSTVGGRQSNGTWYVTGYANVMASSPVISSDITGDTSKLIDLI